MNLDPEIPPHRKRATRKRFGVKWVYIGDRSEFHKYGPSMVRILTRPHVDRYRTRKAAEQAITDWRAGRGTFGAMRSQTEWSAEVVED